MTCDYPKITPAALHDDDGYWLASYNADTGRLILAGYHFWHCHSDRSHNAAQRVVSFLRMSGFNCRGYWEGYVDMMVHDRLYQDIDLPDEEYDYDLIDGAETIALEQIISEEPNFLQDHCSFIPWLWPPDEYLSKLTEGEAERLAG